ncbi:class I SAM-dependent methyltransferase [Jidongwangia harbinensis]|uniref:class I SAM-dependent methyltransferase n=1 Tax=Jidongwangia harbinensis TaxID=2878561 RepID=UPI001CDA3021|nr:class I SAM-dependent methyltransferase [Jidongwangia harbinensis]MCA2213932.1 class I SAM-dependent methyltransferase [Jidongwangia harbinensis]
MSHSHLAEMLDLDAEVLQEYHRDVLSWVGSLTPARPRIVDLGAGTGTGTLALIRQLPDAEVVAVDVSEQMLEHLRHRAGDAGVADRIRTVQADLDQPWPDLGPADLIWASASLHHMVDPGDALAQARATLRPGGLVVVTELDSFPRFLPDPAGAALEERCHAVMAELRAEAGLHMHEDWSARLTAAGLTVEAEQRFDIALQPPLPPAAGRYAHVTLHRMRERLDDRLGAGDLAALDAVTAGIADRDDLTVRATRTVWLARRPG